MVIRKENEARRGMNDGTVGVEAYSGDNFCQSHDHDDVLCEEKSEKCCCNRDLAIVKGMHLLGVNTRADRP